MAPRTRGDRRRRLGRAHERRRDGEHHGDDRRARRLAPDGPGHGGRPARRRARRRARLRRAIRPTSRSRAALGVLGFPDETLRVLPSDDRFRLEAASGRRGDRRRTGRPGSPRSRSRPSPVRRTPARSTTFPGSPTSPSARASGSTSTRPTAAPRACRTATPIACPGLERADSVTVDPHKWFFQAYDIGGLVVRRREDLLRTFHESPEYYRSARPEDEPLDWYQYSLEGTRRFRALKLWMSWKQLGTAGLGALVEHNDDLATYFARRCAAEPDLEATPTEPELSIVCFRHLPAGSDRWPAEALDRYQAALQRALEVSGEAWVSVTTLRDRTYLRAGFVNYLSVRGRHRRDGRRPAPALRRRPRRPGPRLTRRRTAGRSRRRT